ncbi:MFS transporter [Nocardia higoensis]|uniref:MFS transporter n=1 Tax=Nocardia higoensis TaxID=228599 RepID=UPI0005930DA9|nr:MFS transporter [Nocardia higoensis]
MTAATAYVVGICGSNGIVPLLPRYQDKLGLSAFESAVIFAMYFVPLVAVLLIGARTPLARYSRFVLIGAMGCAVAANLLLLFGSSVGALLYPGRFLVGLCSALATGAGAAVMSAGLGPRGRQFVSGASMFGAGVGLALSTAVVVWLPGPMTTVYLLNIVVSALCGLVLVADLRSGPLLLPEARASTASLAPARPRPRQPIAYLIGALAWAIGALATGVFPAAVLRQGVTDSLPVALALCGSALFAAAAATVPREGVSRWIRTIPAAAVAMAAGMLCAAIGVAAGSVVLLLVGSTFSGLVQVAAVRIGQARVTAGLGPVDHGRVVSGYTALAYLGAWVFVVLGGAAVALFGVSGGVLTIAAIFAACCLAVGAAAHISRTRFGVVADRELEIRSSDCNSTAECTRVMELLPARSGDDTVGRLADRNSEGEWQCSDWDGFSATASECSPGTAIGPAAR